MGSIDPVFVIAACIAVVSGVLVVTRRNPVYSAVWMLVCFLSFAVLYLKLDATFLAMIHVIVYTGAILVLFLFVIMLLNIRNEELGPEHPLWVRLLVTGFCTGLFLLLAIPMSRLAPEPVAEVDPAFGSVESVGRTLFVDYALAFELVSLLILVAIFAGVALAKRKL